MVVWGVEFHSRNPIIDFRGSSQEVAAKAHLHSQLTMLEIYWSQFRHAVSLIDLAEKLMPDTTRWTEVASICTERMGWMHIACRDAVLTVYHFGVTLDTIRRNAGRCCSLRGTYDAERIKDALSCFRAAFPHYEKFRHAIGHLADDVSSVEKAAEYRSRSAETSGLTIVGDLSGRLYTFGVRDTLMQLLVATSTSQILEAILLDVWESFRPDPMPRMITLS